MRFVDSLSMVKHLLVWCPVPDSPQTNIQTSQVLSAMIGLAAPIALGLAVGHGRIGMAASLGGLFLSGSGNGESLREQMPDLLYALGAGCLAMFVGSMICGDGITALCAMTAVAAIAALVGGITRPMARASARFILFSIVAAHALHGAAHPFGATILFLVGAVWTAVLSLALRPLFQALNIDRLLPGYATPLLPTRYSWRQLLQRWAKSLLQISGWRYTLRITLSLLVAGGYSMLLPRHHGYWALITVGIVVHRDIRATLRRTVERAAGTAVGALLASLVGATLSSNLVVVAAIAVLAAARPILREMNYTAYAAVQTPLVILLLDFDRVPSAGLIFDRLAATLVGCVVALIFGYLGWHKVPASAPTRSMNGCRSGSG